MNKSKVETGALELGKTVLRITEFASVKLVLGVQTPENRRTWYAQFEIGKKVNKKACD